MVKIDPFTVTVPSVGLNIPEIIFNVVLFPLPLSPMRPNTSPFFTLKLTFFNAIKESICNFLFIFLIKNSFTLSVLFPLKIKLHSNIFYFNCIRIHVLFLQPFYKYKIKFFCFFLNTYTPKHNAPTANSIHIKCRRHVGNTPYKTISLKHCSI